MDFDAEHYYQAAEERIRQARQNYDQGKSYALAMYCGGLAVECLLRAFRWLEDRSFEGRHEMGKLLKESHFLTLHETQMRDKGVSDEYTIEVSDRRYNRMLWIVD